jgi:hypothetical protein
MLIDLHGYHPNDVDVASLLKQAWEIGEPEVTLIHGHGHNRGVTLGFVNTNTGFFGLSVRRAIRNNRHLAAWVKISTLDCSQSGSTTIKLKPNPQPSGTRIALPERTYDRRR